MYKNRVLSFVLAVMLLITSLPIDILTAGKFSTVTSAAEDTQQQNIEGSWADAGVYDISWYSHPDDPVYYIDTPEQFGGLIVLANGLHQNAKISFKDKTIKLTSTINLNAKYTPWIEVFEGTLDGGVYDENNKLLYTNGIKNLKIVRPDESAANSSSREQYSGGIAGINKGTIKNLKISGFDMKTYRENSGGIAGKNEGTIENVILKGQILGVGMLGGIAGTNTGKIKDVMMIGDVGHSSTERNQGKIGGIVGYNDRGNIEFAAKIGGEVRAAINGATGSRKQLGGLVGLSNGGRIYASYNTGSVRGLYDAAFTIECVGGIVGESNNNTTIEQCYNTGMVTGHSHVGGIFGYITKTTIKNFYTTGEVFGRNDWNTGSIGGTALDSSSISLGYTLGPARYYPKQYNDSAASLENLRRHTTRAKVPTDWMNYPIYVSYIIGHKSANVDNVVAPEFNWWAFWKKTGGSEYFRRVGTTGFITSSHSVVMDFINNEKAFVKHSEISSINGFDFPERRYPNLAIFGNSYYYTTNVNEIYKKDENGVYLIENEFQLYMMPKVNTPDAKFKLTRNIYITRPSGAVGNWVPFELLGEFDGNGYSICNLMVIQQGSAGLFTRAKTVKNLSIFDGVIVGTNNVGAIAGEITEGIYNCSSDSLVIGDSYVGGIAGITKKAEFCRNHGIVEGKGLYVGGIAGYVTSSAVKCSNTGSIKAAHNYAGGIVGFSEGATSTVSMCYNTGDITSSTRYAGGIVGGTEGTVQQSFNYGKIIADVSEAGGIAGQIRGANSSIKYSYNLGNISSSSNFGAIAGEKASESQLVETYYYCNINKPVGNSNAIFEEEESSIFLKLSKTTVKVGENFNILNLGSGLRERGLGENFRINLTLKDSKGVEVSTNVARGQQVGNGYIHYKVDITQNRITTQGFERGLAKFYKTVEIKLPLFVGDAPMAVDPIFPVAGRGQTGQKLGEIPLIGGEGDGIFMWENAEEEVKGNKRWYTLLFVPNPDVVYNWSEIQGYDAVRGVVVREIEVYVEPIVVDVEWSGYEDREYDGNPSNVTAKVLGIANGDFCEVIVAGGGAIDAGTHSANIVWISNSTYSVSAESSTKSYTILPKEVGLEWYDEDQETPEVPSQPVEDQVSNNYTPVSTIEREYNGQEAKIKARINNLAARDLMSQVNDGYGVITEVNEPNCVVTVEGGNYKDVGSYTAVATALSNPNYKLPANASQNYVINPKPVTFLWSPVATRVYDGTASDVKPVIQGVIEGDICNPVMMDGDKKDAGTHKAIVLSLDNENYSMPLTDLEYQYIITKKPVNPGTITDIKIPNQVQNSQQTKVISGIGFSSTDIVAGETPTLTASVTTPSIANLGQQSNATVNIQSIDDTNYSLTASGHTISNVPYNVIEKGIKNIEVTTAPNLVYSYGDNLVINNMILKITYEDDSIAENIQSSQFENKHLKLNYKDQEKLDLSDDKQKIIIKGPANNESGEYTKEVGQIAVSPRVVELTWNLPADMVYDGNVKKITATAGNLANGDSCFVIVSGTDQKTAGTHVATASKLSNPNYALPNVATKSYDIQKRPITVAAESNGKLTYNSAEQTMDVRIGNVISGDGCTVTVSNNVKRDVGRYTATVTEVSNPNYKLPDDTAQRNVEFEILPKEIGINWENATSRSYDGQASNVTASAALIYPGDTCTITVTGGNAKDAGTHTAVAASVSNANYKLPSSSHLASKTYLIKPKIINNITLASNANSILLNSSLTQTMKFAISSSEIISGDTVEVEASVRFPKTDAEGSYRDATATVTRSLNPNYSVPLKTFSGVAYGVVAKAINDIQIVKAPSKISYTYGEKLDFSDISFNILYASGEKETNLNLAQLMDRGLSLNFSHGDKASVAVHHGRNLTITNPTNSNVISICNLSVSKKLISNVILPLILVNGELNVSLYDEVINSPDIVAGDVVKMNGTAIYTSNSPVGTYYDGTIIFTSISDNVNYYYQDSTLTGQKYSVVSSIPNDNNNNNNNNNNNGGNGGGGGDETPTSPSPSAPATQTPTPSNAPVVTPTPYPTIPTPAPVYAPYLNIQPGTVKSGTTITVAPNPDGTLRKYTIDGSYPHSGSPDITSITLYQSTSIKVLSADQKIDTLNYTVLAPVNIQPGEVPWGTVIQVLANPDGSKKPHTIDGSQPNASSPLVPDSFTITNNITIGVYNPDGSVNIMPYTVKYPVDVQPGIVSPGTKVTLDLNIDGTPRYYTTDGTTPTSSSQSGRGPITINEDTIVKVLYPDGNVATLYYTIKYPVNFQPGEIHEGSVVIFEKDIDGSDLHYTLDGSTPNASSRTGPFVVDKDTVVKVYRADGTVDMLIYVVKNNIVDVRYEYINKGAQVDIGKNEDGTARRYTTDRSTPTEVSTLAEGLITINEDTVVKALNKDNSISTIYYVVNRDVNVQPGVVERGTQIQIPSNSDGSAKHYTADGTNPTAESPIIEGAITIDKDTVIKVLNEDNSITTLIYRVKRSVDVQPGTVPKGTYVNIDKNSNGSIRHYTIDGSTPSTTSPTASGPIILTKDTVIKILNTDGSVEKLVYTVRKPITQFKENAKNIRYISLYQDRTFSPAKFISRYETVASLSNVVEVEAVKSSKSFSDTSDKYILAFARAGILDGFPGGRFEGQQGLTRAEFVKIMSIVKGFEPTGSGMSRYPDTFLHWADEYINAFDVFGYVKGYEDGEFRPGNELTRGEFATIVNRMTGVEIKKYPTSTVADMPNESSHWSYDQVMNAYRE